MKNKKILNDSIKILIIPLFFILTEYLETVSLKIFLSIFIFYFYIGYNILQTLKNLLKLDYGDNYSSIFHLIQDLSFSYLIGLILNSIYGILASSFLIYSNRLFYFIFFEIILLINYFCQKRIYISSSEITKSYSVSDFLILTLLLFPSIVQVIIIFYYSPYPLMQGWDILLYQGNTNQFLVGRLKYSLFEFTTQPPGFNFIQANIVLSTKIPTYFLIFFNKIAVIFINGFTCLWIYLICFKITKSHYASLIPSMLISTFDGHIALGPYYVLPSSFSWQIGIIVLYFLMFKIKIIEDFKTKKNKSDLIFYGYFCLLLLLILICYLFHFFTAIVISFIVLLDFVLEFSRFKHKRVIFSVFLFILVFFILFQNKILIINQIFNFISSYVDKILTANIEIWPFALSFTLLFGKNSSLINPLLGISSTLIITLFRRKEYDLYIVKFYLFLILFFIPIKAVYRITYIIFVFSAILQSIALHELYKSNLRKKIAEKIGFLFKRKFSNIHLKTKKMTEWFSLHDRKAILIFLILINPVFTAMHENFKAHANNQIYIPDSERIGYSAYSYDEYNAAVWLYENFDRKISNISADPGSNFFLYAISGIPCLRFEIDNQEYRSFYLSCGEQGLNTSLIEKLTKHEQQNLILVITARFHKWIQTNSSQERGVVDKIWLNHTLLEYIENTPWITKIYSNSEVYIYDFQY